MLRNVIDGERLSGHGSAAEGFPEIVIYDGIGAGNGSMICSIESFHWVTVKVKGRTTELWFENKVCLAVPNAVVRYAYRGNSEALVPDAHLGAGTAVAA